MKSLVVQTFSFFCTAALLCVFTFGVQAKQLELTVATGKTVLEAGKKQVCSLKVGVKGFEMQSEKKRSPLNISLVIDRSGSMTGSKIERAKQAAIGAIRQLESNDIVSVVVFDDRIDVLVPATKANDKDAIERKIKEINAGGSTALYDGTKKGYEEVKKFFEKGIVNRVIVLSDGQANVGPSTVDDFAALGKNIGKEQISITTFGLGDGYDENIMVKLAAASDGNHKFIRNAEEIADIFRKEFNSVQSVVAQECSVVVSCPEGIRPVRSLNMDAEIKGQEIRFVWNQIYSNHERFAMFEVEVPSNENGQTLEIAKAVVKYQNMETKSTDTLSGRVEVRFSTSESAVKESVNKKVVEEYVELIANLNNQRAMALRDSGDISGAQRAFYENSDFLDKSSSALGGSEKLKRASITNRSQGVAAPTSGWGEVRKDAVELQNSAKAQQSY